jgi:hypothetical protein
MYYFYRRGEIFLLDQNKGPCQQVRFDFGYLVKTELKKKILVYGLKERVKCIIFIEEGRYFFWIKIKAPASK